MSIEIHGDNEGCVEVYVVFIGKYRDISGYVGVYRGTSDM